jgi:hypothetical protein
VAKKNRKSKNFEYIKMPPMSKMAYKRNLSMGGDFDE